MQHIADRLDGRAATEATLTLQTNQQVRELSDEEILALIAKQQAAIAAQEAKDEERGTLQ